VRAENEDVKIKKRMKVNTISFGYIQSSGYCYIYLEMQNLIIFR
jgi:hypothetical protein